MTTTSSPAPDSAVGAKAKLALSRAQLLGAMGYQEVRDVPGETEQVVLRATAPPPARGLLSTVGLGVLERWWARHPAKTVVEMGRPLLEDYAMRNPGKLIGYSAGVGALIMLLKPWKLLSAATVVTLLFKGSDIAATVSSLLGSTQPDGDGAPLPYDTSAKPPSFDGGTSSLRGGNLAGNGRADAATATPLL